MAKEIKYEIIEHVADLTEEPDRLGFTKEVNIMTWGNSKKPVIDLRKWKRDDEGNTIMGKGITFSLEEFKLLQKINSENLERYFTEE